VVKDRVKLYMDESGGKLKAARKNLELGFVDTAAHESYYAAENAARALILALEGNIPKGKTLIWRKIRDLKDEDIVTSYIPEEISICYAYRRRADYVEIDEQVEITEDNIRNSIEISSRFISDVERILKDKRML